MGITYYLREQLDEIKRAQADWPAVREFPGLVYIQDAADELRWNVRYLRRRLKAKKIRPVRKWGKNAMGGPTLRSYVPRAIVDQFKQEQGQGQSPDGKVTVQEAAEILRLSGKKVRTLIFRKILRPIGSERVLTQGGQARKVLFLSRADVEKYRDEHTVHFGHAQEAGLEEAKRVLREILGDGKPHFADRSAPASGGARGRV